MELWQVFLYELLGTMVLLIIGLGVNATATLKGTHAISDSSSSNSGTSNWLFVSLGWAAAIMVGAEIAVYTGAAINPALALAYFIVGKWEYDVFLMALLAEFIGALLGAMIVTFLFWSRIKKHENKAEIAGIYVTGNVESNNDVLNISTNFIVELLGTFILAFVVLLPTNVESTSFHITPFFVGFIVFAIAMSIGSITGFSLNPARDLMARLTHMFIPLEGKSPSNWSYSLVSVLAPFAGGALAGWLTLIL